jgi:hypothetical protein
MAGVESWIGIAATKIGPMALVTAVIISLPLLLVSTSAVVMACITAVAPVTRRRHLLAVLDRLIALAAVLRGGQSVEALSRRARR